MTRLLHFALLAWLAGAAASPRAAAQEDPGRESIAQLAVTVYHATDGDPEVAGPNARAVDAGTERLLRAAKHLEFRHYRALGRDVQTLFRGYENWAQPLKPSDEVLVRFEARSRPDPEAIRIGIELWLSRRQILKTDARLADGQPLFILGPEWRGGRLIIAIELVKPANED